MAYIIAYSLMCYYEAHSLVLLWLIPNAAGQKTGRGLMVSNPSLVPKPTVKKKESRIFNNKLSTGQVLTITGGYP